MASDANPGSPRQPGPDDPADAQALADYAQALADALCAAIPAWIEERVLATLEGQRGSVTEAERAAAAAAGRQARVEAEPQLRALLAADIDAQRTTPLAIARNQIGLATEVLVAAGATPVARDAFAQRQAPDDLFDLTPASFADIDPAVAEPGLVWGAAKAHVHLARRRRAGDG